MDVVKIVILNDNTSIITRLSELKNNEGESLCFNMAYPFLLESIVDEEGTTNIRFSPYNVYIKDNEIRLPFSVVKHVCDAKSFIHEKYVEVIRPFDPVWAERITNIESNTDGEKEE